MLDIITLVSSLPKNCVKKSLLYQKVKMTYTILILIAITILYSCRNKSDKKIFKDILNNPKINSREVGEQNGIKYFQYMENDKTGFRDLDGNITVKAIYDSAEMFSEDHSAVEINGFWGLINEKGEYVIKPKYERLGDLKNGLMSFRKGDKVGFIDLNEKIIIEPKFYWVDEFSEGLCVVSTDFRSKEPRKYSYIDKNGKLIVDFTFDYAMKFENGKGKVLIDKLWGAIDKTGKIIIQPKYKYSNEF